MYFSNSILFQWILVILFGIFLCLIGHLEISASTLYHKCHCPQSHYYQSNDIGIAKKKKSYFSFTFFFFFWKNKPSISNTPQYSFFCLGIRHQYHFYIITHFSIIFYSSIQRRSLVLKKMMFEFLEAPVH